MRRTQLAGFVAVVLTACASASPQAGTPQAATPQSTTRPSTPTTIAPNVTIAPTATTATTAPTATNVTTATTATAAGSLTATTAADWPGPCGRQGAAPATYQHVIWIWMENKNDTAVIGSKQAPFQNSLAASCATATNFVDDGIHPSLPNYIAATSGDRQGIANDRLPAAHPLDVDNIFRQVRATGRAAKSYMEAMPKNCSLTSTSRYAAKHNPAAYYVGADDRAACSRDDVPFDQLAGDLAGGLPAFAFVTPDICNDMHDCSVATGDAWLRTQVGLITASAAYRAGTTALFITFDESESHGQAAIPFVAILPTVVAGTTTAMRLDHYSLLAFTEDVLGIPTHLGHAAGAASLAAALGQ